MIRFPGLKKDSPNLRVLSFFAMHLLFRSLRSRPV